MNEIVDILKKGGVAALPTDNFYCLAADASNESAVNKVFKLKGRSNSSALPILIADLSDVNKYTINRPECVRLISEKYWPGALTIVLEKSNNLAPNISAGLDTIGIRIPNSDFIRNLIRKLGSPITGTSANLSGTMPATSPKEIELSLSRNLDFVYKDSTTPGGLPSTILDLSTRPARILRDGAIKKSELKSIFKLHKLDLI